MDRVTRWKTVCLPESPLDQWRAPPVKKTSSICRDRRWTTWLGRECRLGNRMIALLNTGRVSQRCLRICTRRRMRVWAWVKHRPLECTTPKASKTTTITKTSRHNTTLHCTPSQSTLLRRRRKLIVLGQSTRYTIRTPHKKRQLLRRREALWAYRRVIASMCRSSIRIARKTNCSWASIRHKRRQTRSKDKKLTFWAARTSNCPTCGAQHVLTTITIIAEREKTKIFPDYYIQISSDKQETHII